MTDSTGESLLDVVAAGLRAIGFIERSGIEPLEARPGHVVLRAPAEPNVNHFGTMYAGALYTLGECIGGALFRTSFDTTAWFPLVTGSTIRFTKIALGDITAEARLHEDEIARILSDAEATGKGSWDLEVPLLDSGGDVVATYTGHYQMRPMGSLT